jgi:hypothetical protein
LMKMPEGQEILFPEVDWIVMSGAAWDMMLGLLCFVAEAEAAASLDPRPLLMAHPGMLSLYGIVDRARPRDLPLPRLWPRTKRADPSTRGLCCALANLTAPVPCDCSISSRTHTSVAATAYLTAHRARCLRMYHRPGRCILPRPRQAQSRLLGEDTNGASEAA